MKKPSVLLSIKPSFAYPVIFGIKTTEFRRKFNSQLEKGTKVYIYASSPKQMIIGEAEVRQIDFLYINDLWKENAISGLISWDSFKRYFDDLAQGYAIKLYKQVEYSQPLTIKEFNEKMGTNIKRPPQNYQYI